MAIQPVKQDVRPTKTTPLTEEVGAISATHLSDQIMENGEAIREEASAAMSNSAEAARRALSATIDMQNRMIQAQNENMSAFFSLMNRQFDAGRSYFAGHLLPKNPTELLKANIDLWKAMMEQHAAAVDAMLSSATRLASAGRRIDSGK